VNRPELSKGKLLPFLRILPAVMVFVMGATAAAQSVPSRFTVESDGGGCGLTGFEPALIFVLAALLFRRR